MCYEVFVCREVEGHGFYVRQPDDTELFIPLGMYPASVKPTFILREEHAHELIEALQEKGVQPKQLTKIEGQYDAQGKHLSDLQAILKKQSIM